MKKYLLFVIFSLFIIYNGCSSDDDNTVTPVIPTDPNLLATVSGDSVGRNTGMSTVIQSISGQTLNFTGSDSARITFYCSGENNTAPIAFKIYYSPTDSTNSNIYTTAALTITSAEQLVNVTVPSPNVNAFFRYQIQVLSASGFAYFKFRDLKIYKK